MLNNDFFKDKALIDSYLNDPRVRQLLPSSKRYTKFLWGIPDPETNIIDLYILKSNRNDLPPLSGSVVIDAAHMCMTTRGIHKTETSTVTSRMLGTFRKNANTRA